MHCSNKGFICAFDTVIVRGFTELRRAPPKNQNTLTGSNVLYLGSQCELGEGQGRVGCRYQGLVLLHFVSQMSVCVSLVGAGVPGETWGIPACKAKGPSNHSTLGAKETQY